MIKNRHTDRYKLDEKQKMNKIYEMLDDKRYKYQHSGQCREIKLDALCYDICFRFGFKSFYCTEILSKDCKC